MTVDKKKSLDDDKDTDYDEIWKHCDGTPSWEEQVLRQKISNLGGMGELSRSEYIRYLTLVHVRVDKMPLEMATEYATLLRDENEAGGENKLSRDKCIRLRALNYMAQSNMNEQDATELVTLLQEEAAAGYEIKDQRVISRLTPEKFARSGELLDRFHLLRERKLFKRRYRYTPGGVPPNPDKTAPLIVSGDEDTHENFFAVLATLYDDDINN